MGQQAGDEEAMRTSISAMEKGWIAKSGEQFAASFADVHDYIVWNGYYFPNMTKAQNAAGHQNLFSGPYRTLDLMLKPDKFKFIRTDLALVHCYGATYEKGTAVPENPTVLMTILFEKKDGVWKIISFHNLDLESFQDKEIADHSPMPVKVMYAGWYKK